MDMKKKCVSGDQKSSLRLPLYESLRRLKTVQEEKMSLLAEQEIVNITLPPCSLEAQKLGGALDWKYCRIQINMNSLSRLKE